MEKVEFLFSGAMDAFARGLRNAARIIEEGVIERNVEVRPDMQTGLTGH